VTKAKRAFKRNRLKMPSCESLVARWTGTRKRQLDCSASDQLAGFHL